MVPLHAPQFNRLRRSALLLGVSNALIIIMGIVIVVVVVAGGDSCKDKGVAPVIVTMMVSVIRISAMIATGIAQQHTASSILTTYTDLPDSQAAIRQQRRVILVNPDLILFAALVRCNGIFSYYALSAFEFVCPILTWNRVFDLA
ncbi:hypothetical protein BC332_06380 [Capsicum chinense]|nr:hypothetical protein BC332_06380 [Capsicum chinense]